MLNFDDVTFQKVWRLPFYETEGLRARETYYPMSVPGMGSWTNCSSLPSFLIWADSTGSWKMSPWFPSLLFPTSQLWTRAVCVCANEIARVQEPQERQMLSLECRSPNLRQLGMFGVWGHYCHVLKEHQRRRHLGMFSSVCTLDMKPGIWQHTG